MGSGPVVYIFILMALVSVTSAIMMLRSHNAIHSALWLVLNFTAIAVLYVVLNAPFIAMVADYVLRRGDHGAVFVCD